MSPLRALLVDTNVRNLFLGTSQHSTLHSTDHDGIDRTPGQTSERANSLGSGTGLKQFDNEGRHQCGDTAVTLGPRHCQFFDSAVTEFELGNACLDDGLELTSVQVTPLALAPAIDMRPLGGVGGVAPNLTLLQNHFDHHTLVRQGQVNSSDRPRGLQSEKMLIQRGIFHAQAGNIESLDCPEASEI